MSTTPTPPPRLTKDDIETAVANGAIKAGLVLTGVWVAVGWLLGSAMRM